MTPVQRVQGVLSVKSESCKCPSCGQEIKTRDWHWVIWWPGDELEVRSGMPQPGGSSKAESPCGMVEGRIVFHTRDLAKAEAEVGRRRAEMAKQEKAAEKNRASR